MLISHNILVYMMKYIGKNRMTTLTQKIYANILENLRFDFSFDSQYSINRLAIVV